MTNFNPSGNSTAFADISVTEEVPPVPAAEDVPVPAHPRDDPVPAAGEKEVQPLPLPVQSAQDVSVFSIALEF